MRERGELVDGRFRLERIVGRGGMGRVWLAEDERLGRRVALKELLFLHGTGDEERRRFDREARALARMRHDAVVAVHDLLSHLDPPAIVMEYVDGPSLKDVLRTSGKLPVPEAARLGLAVLGALREAHGKDIVHRDLKPANILVAGPRVVVTDFGVALLDDMSQLTALGGTPGTSLYMAPEQLEDDRGSAASDLWSLGAVLWETVEGRQPFSRTTQAATVRAICDEAPPEPAHAGALTDVIRGLLVKDPASRLTAEEVSTALAAATAPPPEPRPSRVAPAAPAKASGGPPAPEAPAPDASGTPSGPPAQATSDPAATPPGPTPAEPPLSPREGLMREVAVRHRHTGTPVTSPDRGHPSPPVRVEPAERSGDHLPGQAATPPVTRYPEPLPSSDAPVAQPAPFTPPIALPPGWTTGSLPPAETTTAMSAPVRELVALVDSLHADDAGTATRLRVLVKAAQNLTPPQLAAAAGVLSVAGRHQAEAEALLREAGRRLPTPDVARLTEQLRREGRHDAADLVLKAAAKHRGVSELHELRDALRIPPGQEGTADRRAHSRRDVRVLTDAANGAGRAMESDEDLRFRPPAWYTAGKSGPATAPEPGTMAEGAAQAVPPHDGGLASPVPDPETPPFAPFWFAVPVVRQIVAEADPHHRIGELVPGVWNLAVGERGEALVVVLDHRRRGLLRDTSGIERG
ncbi:protein kinase [Streptomyces zhihengii]|uniref:serine/threonine-protein kinase n=1 Tax=Streptomyces zhihengii TaxID=1818004 RepID=UPI0036AD9C9F